MAKQKKKVQKPAPTPPLENAGKTEIASEPAPVFIKKLNIPLILITLGIFAVLTPTLYFVHGWQVEGNADKLKLRAEAAETEGEYEKAMQLYGQYLNFRDDDFEALLHYLRLRDGMATTPQALSRVVLGYEELLRRDPDQPDEVEVRQDIVALAMTLRDYSLALLHLERLLEDSRFQKFRESHPDQLPEWRFQTAQCRQAEGSIKEAFEGYVEVLEAHPAQHKYYLPLAILFANQASNLPLRSKPDPENPEPAPVTLSEKIHALLPYKNQRDFAGTEAADQILEWMADQADSKAEAYLVRAGYRFQRNQLEEARQDVESSRSREADNPTLLMFSAQLGVDQARNARLLGRRAQYFPFVRVARQDAAQGRAQNPKDVRFPQLQSLIENEVREGLGLLPAIAEKPGKTRQISQKHLNPLQQEQWVSLQKSEQILRDGLETAASSLKELKTQPPQRTSLRIQEKTPRLNRYQLSQIAVQLRWSLADTLISEHMLVAEDSHTEKNSTDSLKTEVNEQVKLMKESGASTGLIEFLTARLLVAEENWKEAAWTLEETRLRLAKQPAIIQRIDVLLDQCHDQMGNPDQQLQVALRAVREMPTWLPAHLRLAGAYQKANRPEDALKAYQRIQQWPGASLAIARIELQKELNKPAQSRTWDQIYAALDSAKTQSLGNSASVPILRAEILGLEAAQLASLDQAEKSEEKYKQAEAELETAIASSPKSPELRAARGLLELSLPYPKNRSTAERIQAAATIVEQAILDLGQDQLPLRLAAVQIATFLPPEEALKEIAALEKPAFPAEKQPDFLEGLSRAHALLGIRSSDPKQKEAAFQRAMEYRKQAAALKSTDIESQIELAELALSQKDLATLQTAIDRVTKVEGPNGPNGNYLTAMKLIFESKLAEIQPGTKLSPAQKQSLEPIRRLLTQAKKDRPFWTVLPRRLGDLELAAGNEDGAIMHYEEAYQLGDRNRSMITRMVDHYYTRQQVERADEFLRKLALDTPILLSGELARWKWRVDWQMRRYQEAVGVASQFASHSKNYEDHIWESRLRFSRGERGASVLDPLLKARDLAKEKPQPWLALVSYYARIGKTEEAKAIIEEAKKKENLAQDPPHQRFLALARCYDLLNDRKLAEENYQAALTAAEAAGTEPKMAVRLILADFYSRAKDTDPAQQKISQDKANQFLNMLLDSREDVPQATRDWARRRKAEIAASSGRYDDTQRALKLLAKGRTDEKLSDEDLRTEAKILQARNRYRDRLALIKILETLESRNTLSLDERLLLARSYENTNQWPKAQEQFQDF